MFNSFVMENKTAVAVKPRPDLLPLFASLANQSSTVMNYGRKRRETLDQYFKNHALRGVDENEIIGLLVDLIIENSRVRRPFAGDDVEEWARGRQWSYDDRRMLASLADIVVSAVRRAGIIKTAMPDVEPGS